MLIRWKRLSEPREADPLAHTHRSEPKGLPSTVTRSRQTGTKSYGLKTTSWRVVDHTVSYEVNALLLQYTLNRLNILLILAGNANVTLDPAVTVLKNFELKRDTIQAENDVPAR